METKIKEYRERKGITQEELAEKSGISRTTISYLENNLLESTTNTTMLKIAEALNCKIRDIFLIWMFNIFNK